ncbi:MAG: hypothetical protein M3438_06550 [Pseudomonadota bacterium]|nr:hypothetical protein [Sphingomonas sp.]MDQ3478800.1 hypothetical protein [Pseudomonadota bacterium]
MGSRHLMVGCALLLLAGGSACAVNRPTTAAASCIVQGGELLPPETGGAAALCAEIEAATAGLPTPARVSVRVLSPVMLAADVTVGDRALPQIKMARSDSQLDRAAFRRFAQAIAIASAAD